MQGIEVTPKRTLSVWWLLIWRGMLGVMILETVFGFLVGFIGVALGITIDDIDTVTIVAIIVELIVVQLAWGFLVAGMALRKNYLEFRIVLVPHSSN